MGSLLQSGEMTSSTVDDGLVLGFIWVINQHGDRSVSMLCFPSLICGRHGSRRTASTPFAGPAGEECPQEQCADGRKESDAISILEALDALRAGRLEGGDNFGSGRVSHRGG